MYFKKSNNNLVLRYYLTNYLPGDILVKTDRASMANGLELRSPFLDREFASFCMTLPYNLKITKNQNKIILRMAYQRYWTKKIRKRKKQGFGAPIDTWLQDESVIKIRKFYLEDRNRKIFSILSYDRTRKYLNNNYKTWILLNLSLWLENHDYQIT